MIIFLKCSFKSSDGYKTGKYDIAGEQLSFVPEGRAQRREIIPEAIDYTLTYNVGKSILLATDENGFLFLGVFGLIEGDYEKYVNAVFVDYENEQPVMSLFHKICLEHASAMEDILGSIQRANKQEYSEIGLEFKMNVPQVAKLISGSSVPTEAVRNQKLPGNRLYAFITSDRYDDYQSVLERQFDVGETCIFENWAFNSELSKIYELAIQHIMKSSPRIGIIIAACVSAVLFVLYMVIQLGVL